MGFHTAPGAMISVQVDINHNKWVSVNPGDMKVTEGQAMKLYEQKLDILRSCAG